MTATLPHAALLAIGLLLAGCSATGTPTGDPVPAAPGASESPATGSEDNDGHLCGVVTPEEMETIFGIPVGAGERVTSIRQDNGDFQVVGPMCRWEVEDVIEIELVYTQGASFESGALECEELDPLFGEVIPVSGLGAAAWWSFDDSTEVTGVLQACTTADMIDIQIVAAEGDSAEMQAQATAVIEKVLALL